MTPTAEGMSFEDALHNPALGGPVPLATLQSAKNIIDTNGVGNLVDEWDAADNPAREGGRPASIPIRAILTLWLVLALEERPLHLREIQYLLTERLRKKGLRLLEIRRDRNITASAWYERARRSHNRLLRLIDDKPLPNRQRALTKAEWENALAERERNADVLAIRTQRADTLMNGLLEATRLLIPTKHRIDDVSVTIDATALPIHAHGVGKEALANRGPDELVSIEPDAGFWNRQTEDHTDTGQAKRSKTKYAYELEIGVLNSNDPTRPDAVPHIAIGIGHHAPGYGPGKAARAMFENIVARGLKLDHVVSDRAYLPGAKPEELQNFLRLAGAKLVMDYKKTELGFQATHGGAIQVDGSWYCPVMPTQLVNATQVTRGAEDATELSTPRRERVARAREIALQRRRDAEARAPYLLRAKERMDERGTTPMMCPAVGPSATATCAASTRRISDIPAGKVALTVITNPPKELPRVCSNKSSIAIPLEAGAKHAQHYQYRSEEWQAHYSHGRNCVEGFNAYIKDGARYTLADPSRRRLRGATAQFLLATVAVVAANIEKIRDFVLQQEEITHDTADGIAAPLPRKSRTRRSTSGQRVAERGRGRLRPQNSPLRT
ncbi:hypothetical protein ACQUSY_07360 [Microbacterium sp. YY-03]|uniref:hypothetical protein n=1 Tax=Microbacterium sp. YY-03 TaxID=3421636 RepID=UPI003D163C79